LPPSDRPRLRFNHFVWHCARYKSLVCMYVCMYSAFWHDQPTAAPAAAAVNQWWLGARPTCCHAHGMKHRRRRYLTVTASHQPRRSSQLSAYLGSSPPSFRATHFLRAPSSHESRWVTLRCARLLADHPLSRTDATLISAAYLCIRLSVWLATFSRSSISQQH